MPEVRLIDADAEVRKREKLCEEKNCEYLKYRYQAMCKGCSIYEEIEAFDSAEEVEAEPVRHGKLLEGKTFNDQHCSVCGQRFRDDISFILPSDENGFPMPKRCPECGCYWDGGADNG